MTRLGGAILLLAASVAPQPQYFRYERSLTVPSGSAATPQICAVLDAGVFVHAASGLPDLRLYLGDPATGQETPYVLRQSVRREDRKQAVALMNLGTVAGQTTFDATMPEGSYSDILLDVSGENFIATVTVTGSHDQTSMATRLGAFTIFDLKDQKLGRSTVLHLPPSDFRYLHFMIIGPIKPEQVGGLSIEASPRSEQAWTVVAQSPQIAQKGHETVAQFTLPAHVPVERVQFVVGDATKNFSREVTVRTDAVSSAPLRTDEEPPQPAMATGNLLRMHGVQAGHRIDEENLAIDVAGADFADAATTWTVTIENGDDPPLAIRDVRLEMAERRLCFDRAQVASYSLVYGDAALSAPRYDYATLFAPEKNPSLAQLGPERLNPEYRPRPDDRPFTEKHPALLWAGLILVIVVLGGVALRTAKTTTPQTPD